MGKLGQRGTMRGHLYYRVRGRPENGAWYGKWLVGRTQVLRRLDENEDIARAKLAEIVTYINAHINNQKTIYLMKIIDTLLKNSDNLK